MRNPNPMQSAGRQTKSKNLKVVPFDKWKTDKLRNAFGLRVDQQSPGMAQWISARHPVPRELAPWVERLRETLFNFRNFWNEEELKMKFIAPLLYTVEFSGPGYNSFADRPLSAVVNNVRLTGKPDWMAATGESEPENPYFFLHEYKQIHVGSPDPQGQVLAAMIAAQALNHDGLPVYGCYTVAHIWTFVLLDGQTYSVSQSYDASDKDEILIVWSILQETKMRIERLVAPAVPQI